MDFLTWLSVCVQFRVSIGKCSTNACASSLMRRFSPSCVALRALVFCLRGKMRACAWLKADLESRTSCLGDFLKRARCGHHSPPFQSCDHRLRGFHPLRKLFLCEPCARSRINQSSSKGEFFVQSVIGGLIVRVAHPFQMQVADLRHS